MLRHRVVVSEWHRCCDKATKHIRCAMIGPKWVFAPGFVVITHCPFCGEELPEIKLEKVGDDSDEKKGRG